MSDRDIPTSESSAVWAAGWFGLRLKDRYRIERDLGRGGSGWWYLARAASDIYALGVIIHELVTGKRPFNPESFAHMYVLQQEGWKVSPRGELRPELPGAAEACILKAMAPRGCRRRPR